MTPAAKADPGVDPKEKEESAIIGPARGTNRLCGLRSKP